MGKLILVEFRKMRHYRLIWGILFFSLGEGAYTACDGLYDDFFMQNPGLEYIFLLCRSARSSVILTILASAYVAAEDFSMRTVQNVLTVGVSRKRYFYARLSSLMIFVVSLTALRYVVYIAVRILLTGKVDTAMPAGEFLAAFAVMALQLTAYASVTSAVSMLCRSQAAAILIGEAWVFLSMALRIYMGVDLAGENPAGSLGAIAYEPMTVLERAAFDFLVPGKIFTPGFLWCGVTAILLILASAAAGYLYLQHTDIR